MTHDDHRNMTCERSREAISALLDGEDPGVTAEALDAHLERCAACRRFRAIAAETRRPTAIGEASRVPDLSRRVAKLAAIADRAGARTSARTLLAVVAAEILVFSLPSLVAGDESGVAAHDSRHLGAFTVAYAAALVVVVVRPARARTVLPVACVVAGALVITAVIDLASGNIPLAGEAQHLPELAAAPLVWALTRPPHRPAQPTAAAGEPALRVIRGDRRRAG